MLKDRLWFYGGAAYTKNESSNDATFHTDVSKTERHFERWKTAKYYNYNLTGALTNNMRVRFAGSNQRNRRAARCPHCSRTTAPMMPSNAVYPTGVPSIGITNSTFDANADGSINQTAFNNRWVRPGGRLDERHLLGQLRLDHPSELLRQRARAGPTAPTGRRRPSSAATRSDTRCRRLEQRLRR